MRPKKERNRVIKELLDVTDREFTDEELIKQLTKTEITENSNENSRVSFGQKAAENDSELAELFRSRYGIDVQRDFYEGDEHYEEYLEAQQAIAEGMSIYGGEIAFDDSVLAELAERVWDIMEEKDRQGFRRINTMLEE